MSNLNPLKHIRGLYDLVQLLTRHRQLTYEMAKRELYDRYTGQVFGIFWSLAHPIIMIGIYVFIFAFVFKAKVGGTREMPLDFTTYLLAGLVPWLATIEAMNKSATVITGNANLVKQVIFPIEVLPVKTVIASVFTELVMFALLIGYVLIHYGALPFVFIFQLLFLVGIAYIFSAIGAYFRDLKDFVQVFCISGIYLMPVFYIPASIPGLFRPLLYVNPFSYMIWCYQDVVYFGRIEHPVSWIVFIFMSVAFFYVGYKIFNKLKLMFGNVL
jgi:lipopolysaccharide transport system permease protein